MVEFQWTIPTVISVPEKDGHENVITLVYWSLVATEMHEGNLYESENFGTTSVAYNTDRPFIPYDDVTQEEMVLWIKDVMGPDMVLRNQDILADDINRQIQADNA